MRDVQTIQATNLVGLSPYEETWQLQESIREEIFAGESGQRLLLVEHPPTISLGRAEKGGNLLFSSDELARQGFSLVETNRGGKVTYHGPGQLVAYPIVDLRFFGPGVKKYVQKLEETMIETLRTFDLSGERKVGCPGVWVNGKKIGSIGIHVRRQISIHGIALNIASNLDHFRVMTPCGLNGIEMTSVKQEGRPVSMSEAFQAFRNAFASVFNCELVQETVSPVRGTALHAAEANL